MARTIYEIKLKNNLQPAHNMDDALDAFRSSSDAFENLCMEDVDIDVLVKEEDAVKLFVFAKTMADTDKFTLKELEATLRTLAQSLGYYTRVDNIVDCVLLWIERLDDVDYTEFGEWLLAE